MTESGQVSQALIGCAQQCSLCVSVAVFFVRLFCAFKMAEKTYLTVQDVAERFGIDRTTAYRLAQRGKLPGFKVGGQWRFDPEVLEAWVADQMTAGRLGLDEEKENPAP